MSARIQIAAALCTGLCAVAGAAPPDAAQLQFFESEIRPLLADHCYRCHSHRAEKLKGGLYLDHGSTLLAGGDAGPVVVPGDPGGSLLIEAVRYKDPDIQMPPKKKLSNAQIAALEKWVAMGAPWPEEPPPTSEKKLGPKDFDLAARRAEHWCWQPVRRGAPPVVRDRSWSSDPIDLHVLAKLEEKGLAPSPRAAKHTLIRRAYFDLIGLPPTPEQVAAFEADRSPEAFAKVVDGLLASPHFGERWARHWMDLVRYAESCGHEFDYPIPHAPEYRDYLIRAFNADVPFDRFATEHIAGDLLEEPRRNLEGGFDESVIGTGFWHLHEATHAPTDVRENEAERVDNQIDVFSKTFLGVTVACARCHDHMFDAISTKDYYALAGYLQSSRRQEAMLDPGGKIAAAAGGLERIKAGVDEGMQKPIAAGVDPETVARYLMAARDALRGEIPGSAGAPGSRADAVSTPAHGAPLLGDLAKAYRIEAATLARWVGALGAAEAKDPAHPLFVWSQFVEGEKNPPQAVFGKRLGDVKQRLEEQGRRRAAAAGNAVKLVDFSEVGSTYRAAGWFADGPAFGDGPAVAGEWSGGNGAAGVPGRAHSGLLARELQGVLRSPTFEITGTQIHLRGVAHKGGLQVRVIVDGYAMEPYNGLLFKGTRIGDADTGGQTKWLTLGGDLRLHRGRTAHLEFIDHGPGFFELDEVWISDAGPPPAAASPLGLKLAGNSKIGSVKGLALAYGWLVKHSAAGDAGAGGGRLLALAMSCGLGDPGHEAALAGAGAQMAPIAKSIPAPRRVQALTDGTAEDEFVFLRGSHKRLGDQVPRRFLTALGGESMQAPPDGSGRLGLARQVVAADNPLTSRVIANRLWHHLLGRGIVPTTDDFGVLGQPPSHPELLDHLAASLVDDGWSIKRALRRIMLSETYAQRSAAGGRGDEVDPQNLLLHRANLRRLQGEAIRDSMLAISGRLDRKMFGKPVPVHLTAFMTGRGRPGSGPLDGAGRRSIYTSVKRNFLPPMMLSFDTPIPFSSMGRRTSSNVPAQALILMNDPFVHGQAELWAKRVAAGEPDPAGAVRRMYLEAFGRAPDAAELAAGTAFLAGAPGGEGLRDYAHVLFNTKEFIFIH